jgi:uncharacterized protein YndB with AHSA1/START domain
MNATASATADREIRSTRLLNAPRELVWEVWTKPEHIAKWWGPNGFTNTIHEMEVKVGGVFRLTMHGPDGVDYPNKIVFTKVIKPERLEYTHGDDENPGHFEVVVTFAEKGKKTELTMSALFKTKEDRDFVIEKYGALEGNRQTLNRLEDYLSKI